MCFSTLRWWRRQRGGERLWGGCEKEAKAKRMLVHSTQFVFVSVCVRFPSLSLSLSTRGYSYNVCAPAGVSAAQKTKKKRLFTRVSLSPFFPFANLMLYFSETIIGVSLFILQPHTSLLLCCTVLVAFEVQSSC